MMSIGLIQWVCCLGPLARADQVASAEVRHVVERVHQRVGTQMAVVTANRIAERQAHRAIGDIPDVVYLQAGSPSETGAILRAQNLACGLYVRRVWRGQTEAWDVREVGYCEGPHAADLPVALQPADVRNTEPTRLAVDTGEVESKSTWLPDPSRARYMFSPTAFTMGAGHGFVSHREAVTSAGVGLVDGLDLEAGAILPAMFSTTPINTLAAKAAVPVAHDVHVGAFGQWFFSDGEALGLVLGNVTIGHAAAHGTAAGGVLTYSDVAGPIDAVVMTVSGCYRMSKSVALLTENWVLVVPGAGPDGGTAVLVVPSGGVRLYGAGFATDLGLVPVFTGDSDPPVIPVPWLGFTWEWSFAREAAGP
jgi:hypothetical protein